MLDYDLKCFLKHILLLSLFFQLSQVNINKMPVKMSYFALI